MIDTRRLILSEKRKGCCIYLKVQNLVNTDADGLFKLLGCITKMSEEDKHELFLALLAYSRVCTVELDRLGVMVKV